MPRETVHAECIGDITFLLKDRNDFPIVTTQPMGANAADLLPLSLIGCVSWDIIAILKKQRQQVTSFSVVAESEQDDNPPWRFKRIHIRYSFSGSDLNPEQVQRAIELSETRYCSTFATMRQVVEITSDYEISNE